MNIQRRVRHYTHSTIHLLACDFDFDLLVVVAVAAAARSRNSTDQARSNPPDSKATNITAVVVLARREDRYGRHYRKQLARARGTLVRRLACTAETQLAINCRLPAAAPATRLQRRTRPGQPHDHCAGRLLLCSKPRALAAQQQSAAAPPQRAVSSRRCCSSPPRSSLLVACVRLSVA